mgnify:CR=1 FL=1
MQNDDLEPEIDIEDGGCTIDGVVAQPPTPRPTTEIPTAIPVSSLFLRLAEMKYVFN